MRKNYLLLVILISQHLFSQHTIETSLQDKFQYGIATKLNIEIQPSMKLANFKLSIAVGVGLQIEAINFSPTLHTGVILFNKGVIGSALDDPWRKINTHFFYSAIGTVKLDTRNYTYHDRYVPFYHFSDFTANPLQNPYKSSFSYGAIWIHMQDKMKQRVGFFNANIVGRAQITYYNDGGYVLQWVGDKRDRYYTGGLLLSYHGNETAAIDLVELSYHKFTGYVKHAFDIADKLQIDFLTYADTSQIAFNHQRWKLNVSDLSTGYSGNISVYDYNSLDLQDFLHFKTNVPYHPDYFNGWRFAFGGRYEYNYFNNFK